MSKAIPEALARWVETHQSELPDSHREDVEDVLRGAMAATLDWAINLWRSKEGAPIKSFWSEMNCAASALRSKTP